MQESTTQARRELAALQSEYNTLMNRKNVLSTLFKRLYEDNVIGRINTANFPQKAIGDTDFSISPMSRTAILG